MKISFNKFFGASFLLFAAVSVWAGKWTIDTFDNSPEPGDPDKYMAAESGKGLTPVKPEQVTRQEDVLYIRQKFEDDLGRSTYQIFRGKAKPAAKSLGKISLEGIPYATLLKMKLFYKRNSDSEDDLEGVYFDGKDIFVEGEDPVYINLNGKMEELKPLASREYDIKITSEPSGAAVSVGSASRGVTPASFTVSASKTIAVVVSKEGFYPIVRPVTPADKGATEEKFSLAARAPMNNPATAYKSQLDAAVQKKDASTIRSIRTSVMQILSNYNTETKKNIDAVLERFPANPPKAAKETPEDFNTRKNLWTTVQNRERDALNREAESYFKELKELLMKIDVLSEELDFVLKYEYVPARSLEPTNLGIKDFSINANQENFSVKFKYSNAKLAYGAIPRNEIAQNLGKIHGVLKLWNVPNENGDFASIYDIAFFYNETPLQTITKGSFAVGNATNASRNTERDLNARIARYPGKASWDKKDSIATLAALRAGAASAPAPKPAPQVASKNLDDDEEEEEEEFEDDDEFEDEMEDQRQSDYSRTSASRSATDIFGNTDEYLFWSGVAFAAMAIGSGVVGFLENTKWTDARKALDVADKKIANFENDVRGACTAIYKDDKKLQDVCFNKWQNEAKTNSLYEVKPLYDIQKDNEKAKKSYNTSRTIWFSAAGLSAAISITLFLW
jgi:hypothetical protein